MDNKSGDSLSGKNKDRRIAGAGSSPARPTKNSRLWYQLRELDRKITKCQEIINCKVTQIVNSKWITKNIRLLTRYDLKRKEVRNKLKGE